MKRLLAVVAVLALSVTTATVARERGPDRGNQDESAQQQDENANQDRNRGGRQGGAGFRRAPNANAQPAPQAAQPQAVQPQAAAPTPNAAQNDRRNFARDNDRRGDNNRRGDNDRRGDNNGRFDNDRRGDNNGRFDNDRRFDNNRGQASGRNFGYQRDPRAGRGFRFRGRNFVSVRAPTYSYPRGYSYRRWTVGALLPLFFLSGQYYADWDYIGLPPPGPGAEWIRYGSDALLVDRYSGRVIDTAYNVFY